MVALLFYVAGLRAEFHTTKLIVYDLYKKSTIFNEFNKNTTHCYLYIFLLFLLFPYNNCKHLGEICSDFAHSSIISIDLAD